MMLAGVAATNVAIPAGTPLAGFAARTAPTATEGELLAVRAIAVSDDAAATLVVVADLTTLSPEQAAALRRRLSATTGLPSRSISVLVTHTHAAPNVDPWLVAPLAPPEVIAAIEDAIVAVGTAACHARVPAKLGHVTGVADLARNRRRVSGPVDSTLDVIRLDTTDDVPIAVVFSYACHPTVIGPGHLDVSPDWPGAARSRVEDELPGAVAIFLQGCCGDCNVGHSAHASMHLGATADRTPAAAARIGTDIGATVAQLARTAVTQAVTIDSTATAVEWVWPPGVGDTVRSAPEASSRPAALGRMRVAWQERMAAAPHDVAESLSIQCFRWGRTLIVQLSGEPFVQLAIDLRRALPDWNVVVAGYSNGVPGYVPYPVRELDGGGYEVDEAHYYYGRPGPVPTWFGQAVLDVTTQAGQHWNTPER